MKPTFAILTSSILLAAAAQACDLCGCYMPRLEVAHEQPFGFYAGVAEQFTHFGTERFNGVKQPNPAGEYIDSSNTQIVLGATFLQNRVGLQLSVPLIYRSYQRLLGFDIDRGHVSGLGDISLTANVVAFHKEALFHEEAAGFAKDGKAIAPQRGEPDFTVNFGLTAGVKLPTGDTSKLKENFAPEVEGAPDTGIGAHDLTLGTGSVDGVFGAQAEVRYKAVFFQADVQYTVRGYGDYNYRFANDLSWSGGPGVFLYRKQGRSIGLQCVVAGETKGYDKFQGVPDFDSGATILSVGPRVTAAFGRYSGEVGVDLPVITNTTKYQTTVDYRIRAGLSIHF
jgi:hypothetical protein